RGSGGDGDECGVSAVDGRGEGGVGGGLEMEAAVMELIVIACVSGRGEGGTVEMVAGGWDGRR
nr:hypothetical protein [Tanacetum cinerariifolium]